MNRKIYMLPQASGDEHLKQVRMVIDTEIKLGFFAVVVVMDSGVAVVGLTLDQKRNLQKKLPQLTDNHSTVFVTEDQANELGVI